jgi:hypothetical protein
VILAFLLVSSLTQAATPVDIAAVFGRGWDAAGAAYAQGGSAESLHPVRGPIAALHGRGANVPGPAQIARLVLLAAAAAAQSERDEMAIFLDEAVRLEALQLAAGEPGAPGMSAHEAAGDLWLQVHRFDEAREAYERAAAVLGMTPRIARALEEVASRQKRTQPPAAAEPSSRPRPRR